MTNKSHKYCVKLCTAAFIATVTVLVLPAIDIVIHPSYVVHCVFWSYFIQGQHFEFI